MYYSTMLFHYSSFVLVLMMCSIQTQMDAKIVDLAR